MKKTHGRINYLGTCIGFYLCLSLFASAEPVVLDKFDEIPKHFRGVIYPEFLIINDENQDVDIGNLSLGEISANKITFGDGDFYFSKCYLLYSEGEKILFISEEDSTFDGTIAFSIVDKNTRLLTMKNKRGIIHLGY